MRQGFMKDSDFDIACKHIANFSIYYFDDNEPMLDCDDGSSSDARCKKCPFNTSQMDCSIADTDLLSPDQLNHLKCTYPELFI